MVSSKAEDGRDEAQLEAEEEAHFINDLLNRKVKEAKKEANFDPLTKLYNKRLFNENLSEALAHTKRSGEPIVLVLMDIDNFKTVNDTHGHVFGDKILEKLGEMMREKMREEDKGYRWGGEELAIIMPNTDTDKAQVAIERLREELGKMRFKTGGKEVGVTLSVGLTEYAEADTSETFINRTDEALYRAKKEGRDRLVVVPKPTKGN
jgi:diguanylate cyclase (GGDEF)-like protein